MVGSDSKKHSTNISKCTANGFGVDIQQSSLAQSKSKPLPLSLGSHLHRSLEFKILPADIYDHESVKLTVLLK